MIAVRRGRFVLELYFLFNERVLFDRHQHSLPMRIHNNVGILQFHQRPKDKTQVWTKKKDKQISSITNQQNARKKKMMMTIKINLVLPKTNKRKYDFY